MARRHFACRFAAALPVWPAAMAAALTACRVWRLASRLAFLKRALAAAWPVALTPSLRLPKLRCHGREVLWDQMCHE